MLSVNYDQLDLNIILSMCVCTCKTIFIQYHNSMQNYASIMFYASIKNKGKEINVINILVLKM